MWSSLYSKCVQMFFLILVYLTVKFKMLQFAHFKIKSFEVFNYAITINGKKEILEDAVV